MVNREIRQTLRLAENQPLGALYIIPIRLEPIKLPVELTRFQHFDFSDDGWKERLSDGVEKRRAQLLEAMTEPPKKALTKKRILKGISEN